MRLRDSHRWTVLMKEPRGEWEARAAAAAVEEAEDEKLAERL